MTLDRLLPEFHDDTLADNAPDGFAKLAREAPKKRGPGAPPGNTNALKHGFYSRRFNQAELADLEEVNDGDLEDEVALLRVSLRRLIEWSHDISSLSEAVSYLRVIAIASASLTRLVRTRHVMGTYMQPDPFYETLAELDAEDEAARQIEQTARDIARRLAEQDAKDAFRRLASQNAEESS